MEVLALVFMIAVGLMVVSQWSSIGKTFKDLKELSPARKRAAGESFEQTKYGVSQSVRTYLRIATYQHQVSSFFNLIQRYELLSDALKLKNFATWSLYLDELSENFNELYSILYSKSFYRTVQHLAISRKVDLGGIEDENLLASISMWVEYETVRMKIADSAFAIEMELMEDFDSEIESILRN